MVALGSQSQADALKVGAAIEEIDILDLQANLETLTAADIRQVYENLLFGSENHLRAFTSVLAQRTGEIYEPQYMDQAAYDAIVAEKHPVRCRPQPGWTWWRPQAVTNNLSRNATAS